MTDYVAELTLRQKQYSYYRGKSLTFAEDNPLSDSNESLNVRWTILIDSYDYLYYRGKTPKNSRPGYIDYDKSSKYIAKEDCGEFMRRGTPKIGDILITTKAPCGNVAQVNREDMALDQRVIKYRPKNPNELNSVFLKYYLLATEFQSKLRFEAAGGTVKGIKGSKLHQLSIPLPPIKLQNKIVEILDKFDSLTSDLTEGLPREIALRQKQYAYYREQLLSFKKVN